MSALNKRPHSVITPQSDITSPTPNQNTPFWAYNLTWINSFGLTLSSHRRAFHFRPQLSLFLYNARSDTVHARLLTFKHLTKTSQWHFIPSILGTSSTTATLTGTKTETGDHIKIVLRLKRRSTNRRFMDQLTPLSYTWIMSVQWVFETKTIIYTS